MKIYNQSLFPLLLLMLMLVTGASSQAQTSKESTPEERAEQWNVWMKEQLDLKPEQENPIHEINLKYARQNEELKVSDGSRKTKFQQLKSNDEKKDQELKVVLTEAQFKLYQEKKKDFQKKMLKSTRDK